MNNFNRRLDSYFEAFSNQITTNNELSVDEVTKYTSKVFMDKWKTSYNYVESKIKKYHSVNLPKEITKNIYFAACLFYITNLFESLSHNNFSISKWILAEIEEWEIRGGLCIYCSVLLYSLLKNDKLFYSNNIKYVQGFYSHNIREDYPSYLPWGGQHNGLHAWITIEEAIVDITIRQQNYFFDFKGKPIVLGDIPEGLVYMGYEENIEVIFQYVDEITKFSKISYDVWLRAHKQNAFKLMVDFIEDDK